MYYILMMNVNLFSVTENLIVIDMSSVGHLINIFEYIITYLYYYIARTTS